MWSYINGNYKVEILDDGTKIRYDDDVVPEPEFPESIDIKITNKCDGACPHCHENSVPEGKEADPMYIYSKLNGLPQGIELAIGGGNPLTFIDSQGLPMFINSLKSLGFIPNVTINAKHLKDIDGVALYAMGISYNPDYHEAMQKFQDEVDFQIVVHMIIGIDTIRDFDRCRKDFDRILLLGYKTVGRGKECWDNYSVTIQHNIDEFAEGIASLKGNIIAFDNLALEQLDMRRHFTASYWDEHYMGNDGQFTMYIDFVDKVYATSSRSDTKYYIGDKNIKEMFAHIKEESKCGV